MQVFRRPLKFAAAWVATAAMAGSPIGTAFAAGSETSGSALLRVAATSPPTSSGQRPQHIPLESIKLAPPPLRKKPAPPVPEEEAEPKPTPAETCKEAAAQLEKCPIKTDKDEPAAKRVHWSYEGEGAPAHWGKLRSSYRACAAGSSQSPINIRDGIKLSLDPIEFEYLPTRINIVDTGYRADIKVGEGLGITVMGIRYKLTGFHFHRPAEGQIEGKSFDMELHLMHQSEEGRLAIIAVMIEAGREHALIQTLLNNLPLEWGMEISPLDPIDPMKLLPEKLDYWTYIGSLTVPPCTEEVTWLVMKQPLQMSAGQISVFRRFYRKNARPLQPLNGRLIKESH